MMKVKRFSAALLCAALLIGSVLPALTASANSFPKIWKGLTHSGALLQGDDCPIEVKSETLTLSVPDFPRAFDPDPEFWKGYQSEMRAEYTFYNPTQETVEVKLAFPCGPMPDYALEREGKLTPDELTAYHEKYGAYVNGEKIETAARYSLYQDTQEFDVMKLLPDLQEDPQVTDFLSAETPVTINLYKISGIDRAPDDYFTGAALNLHGNGDRIVYLSNIDRERYHDSLGNSSGDRYVYQVENGDRVLAVVFGKPPEDAVWEFRKSAVGDPPAAGEATLVSSESITFREFCEREKAVYPDASFTDLFNATALMLEDRETDRILDLDFEKTGAAPVPDMMCSYEYEFTLAPGETLTNTVRAPLYPVIDATTKPPVFEYTYLLSPAAEWAKFGTLEIDVETPYYLFGESVDGFKKVDGGYRLTRDGLPEGELTFSLCKSPVRIPVPQGIGWAAAAFALAICIGGIVGAVALVRMLYKKSKRKNQRTE